MKTRVLPRDKSQQDLLATSLPIAFDPTSSADLLCMEGRDDDLSNVVLVFTAKLSLPAQSLD